MHYINTFTGDNTNLYPVLTQLPQCQYSLLTVDSVREIMA